MRIIMFQSQFAPLVAVGRKCQTVRKTARCKPGDTLSLRQWTGAPYRSQQETLAAVTCTGVFPVTIREDGVWVDGTIANATFFARADGFDTWSDMRNWFSTTHGLPFYGFVIRWRFNTGICGDSPQHAELVGEAQEKTGKHMEDKR